MGRRAKHLSLAQQLSANRERSLKYSRSPQGKSARAASRRPQHRRKGGQHSPPPSGTLPELPPPTERMLELCNEPLPVGAQLFKQALSSPDALDESDLARWKKEPPFVEDEDTTDPYSSSYMAFNKSLVEVLHGVRLREQNARDIQLREDVSTKGRGVVIHELQQEVAEMWNHWERVERLLGERKYHPYHQSREHAMLEHYLQWLARTIYHLYYLKFLE
ncbi:hypothetical protein B0H12DRAFT_1241657 [Mycena haematopus]|nr:hypothetical protein B0H12DRAFT_1241657 [Mycena haematopus]